VDDENWLFHAWVQANSTASLGRNSKQLLSWGKSIFRRVEGYWRLVVNPNEEKSERHYTPPLLLNDLP